MSSRAAKSPAHLGSKVLQQLVDQPKDSRSEVVDVADLKTKEIHGSTTIIERIANMQRGYTAWLALRATSLIGKEPAIDSDADASWRAR